MIKKNGFVFIESVTILVIVVLALTLLLSSYSLLVRKSKSKEYYDLPKDKYLLYNIGVLGNKNGKYLDSNGNEYSDTDSFVIDINNCSISMRNRISNPVDLFKNNNLVYYIIIYDLKSELESSNVTNKYDSPTIEYLKTLKKCKDASCNNHIGYAIGVFCRQNNNNEISSCYDGNNIINNNANNKYYYASLEL